MTNRLLPKSDNGSPPFLTFAARVAKCRLKAISLAIQLGIKANDKLSLPSRERSRSISRRCRQFHPAPATYEWNKKARTRQVEETSKSPAASHFSQVSRITTCSARSQNQNGNADVNFADRGSEYLVIEGYDEDFRSWLRSADHWP